MDKEASTGLLEMKLTSHAPDFFSTKYSAGGAIQSCNRLFARLRSLIIG